MTLCFLLLTVGCSAGTSDSDVSNISSAPSVTDNENVTTPTSASSNSVNSSQGGYLETPSLADVKTYSPESTKQDVDIHRQEMADVPHGGTQLAGPALLQESGQDQNAATAVNRSGKTSNDRGEFEIVNYSSYSTSDIEEWVQLAESKMKTRRANVIAFIYPVGNPNRPEQPIEGTPFNAYEVLLQGEEVEAILDSLEDWFDRQPCIAEDDHIRDEHAEMYREWLERGADTSIQQALCPEARVIFMAITEMMRTKEPITEFQNFLMHEFYHAFQQDLADEGICRRKSDMYNANTIWMVEGAAHYFSTVIVSGINGFDDPISNILEEALFSYYEDGPSMLDGGAADKTGAAGLRLMIEKGLIDESSILDGSLFHACARELVFDSESSDIESIRDSWYRIEEIEGQYQFRPDVVGHEPGTHAGVDNSELETNPIVAGSEGKEVVYDEAHTPFIKYIDSKGLRIFSLEEVSDEFVRDVSASYASMFDLSSTIDQEWQDDLFKIMESSYVFQRTGYMDPDFYGEVREHPDRGPYRDEKVDYIWEVPHSSTPDQIGEVIEHLLHTVTGIGFAKVFPDLWDWRDPESLVNRAMYEAIDKGHYDVSSYAIMKDDEEAYNQTLAQEFAYWLIMAEWDYFDVIGKSYRDIQDEWNITGSSGVKLNLPLGHDLYVDSIQKLITAPDGSFLTDLFAK